MAALEIITKLESDPGSCYKGKSIDFHPLLPYVIFSDIVGCVSIYNYNTKTRIKHFKVHEDICRCVKFHHSLPFFVSGSDDSKVILFDYEKGLQICVFTNHAEYVRSVDFHKTHPWILSSSDDMTVRIFDWQTGKEMAIITGHTDYVMCAKFHPIREDLLFTCSLDATVRAWSIAPLIKKVTSFRGNSSLASGGLLSVDLFASSGYEFLHEMRHERGVNWLAIVDNRVYAVDDDNHVKVWSFKHRESGFTASFYTKLVYHEKSITSVAALNSQYHDMVVTCSEDGQLVLWDMERKGLVKSFPLAKGNLWNVCCHPTSNIIGVAHDQGFLIFKFYRERPTFSVHYNDKTKDSVIYYTKNRSLFKYSIKSQKSSFIGKFNVKTKDIIGMNRLSHNPNKNLTMLSPHPKSSNDIIYTLFLEKSGETPQPTDPSLNILAKTLSLLFNADFEIEPVGGSHQGSSRRNSGRSDSSSMSLRQTCDATCGLYLDNSNYVILSRKKSTLYYVTDYKEYALSVPKATNIFHVHSNLIAIWQESDLSLYLMDVSLRSKKNMSSDTLVLKSTVKNLLASHDHSLLCIQLKKTLVIANMKMEKILKHHNEYNIKGFSWVNADKFQFVVYNDNRIIRYLLLNGESGILTSLPEISYIAHATVSVSKTTNKPCINVFTVNKESEVIKYECDGTEIYFKQSLASEDYDNVSKIIASGGLIGQSIVNHVNDCGYPEVALQFSDINQDPLACFQMALKSQNFEQAYKCAEKLDEDKYWIVLFNASLNVLDVWLCERIFSRCPMLLPRILMIYFLSGNKQKLLELYETCRAKKNYNYQLHCAIMLNRKSLILQSLTDSKLDNLCKIFSSSEEEQLCDSYMEPINASFDNLKFVSPSVKSELLLKVCKLTNTEPLASIEKPLNLSKSAVQSPRSLTDEYSPVLVELLETIHSLYSNGIKVDQAANKLIAILAKSFRPNEEFINSLLEEIARSQAGETLGKQFVATQVYGSIQSFMVSLEEKIDASFMDKNLTDCLKYSRYLFLTQLIFSKNFCNKTLDVSNSNSKSDYLLASNYMKMAYLGTLVDNKGEEFSKIQIARIYCLMALLELKSDHHQLTLKAARNKSIHLGCFSVSKYFANKLSSFDLNDQLKLDNDKKLAICEKNDKDRISLDLDLSGQYLEINYDFIELINSNLRESLIACSVCGSKYNDTSVVAVESSDRDLQESSSDNKIAEESLKACKVCLCDFIDNTAKN